jgi:hypothetical protein
VAGASLCDLCGAEVADADVRTVDLSLAPRARVMLFELCPRCAEALPQLILRADPAQRRRALDALVEGLRKRRMRHSPAAALLRAAFYVALAVALFFLVTWLVSLG